MFDKSHGLEYLIIVNCATLKERCTKGGGPEWFKIQHIRSVNVI